MTVNCWFESGRKNCMSKVRIRPTSSLGVWSKLSVDYFSTIPDFTSESSLLLNLQRLRTKIKSLEKGTRRENMRKMMAKKRRKTKLRSEK
jgi:hypothetical protein